MDGYDQEQRLFAITRPLYMGLHFGSLTASIKQHKQFRSDFETIYPTITRDEVTDLLGLENWRPRVVGAYVCAFKGWHEFEGCIGRLLVRDELIYASVAYSFALACFGSPLSSTALAAYLWNNFSGRCTDYSSIWHAIAALRYIDEKNGSDYYERYVGEWHEKIESGRASLRGSSKEEARDLMWRAVSEERVGGALTEIKALIAFSAQL